MSQRLQTGSRNKKGPAGPSGHTDQNLRKAGRSDVDVVADGEEEQAFLLRLLRFPEDLIGDDLGRIYINASSTTDN